MTPLAKTPDIWLARGSVLVIVALQFAVVNDLTLLPKWLLPSLELVLLAPLSIATAWTLGKVREARATGHWYDVTRYRSWLRFAFLGLVGLISGANLLQLIGLVQAMLGGHASVGRTLLFDAVNIWITNVIVFSLWFWNLDRGGPVARGLTKVNTTDFLFTQAPSRGSDAPEFVPRFVDYVFLAYTNATAFSPADTFPLTPGAKILMMIESAISLITIALVASRAVGILS